SGGRPPQYYCLSSDPSCSESGKTIGTLAAGERPALSRDSIWTNFIALFTASAFAGTEFDAGFGRTGTTGRFLLSEYCHQCRFTCDLVIADLTSPTDPA